MFDLYIRNTFVVYIFVFRIVDNLGKDQTLRLCRSNTDDIAQAPDIAADD